MTTKWPKDTQAARNAFYGDPGKGEIAGQMVAVTPPFAMYYEGKRVKTIQFHKKAAPALMAALEEIWDACNRDQAEIDKAGVSKYAGAYNHRKVRGSKTKWSNHAYAAAIDLNALENGLGQKGNMPQFVIDAFCRQGWMWGGWYTGRKDPMHFEAVDNGGRKPKFAAPVDVAPKPAPKPAAKPTVADEHDIDREDVRGDRDVFHVQRRLKAMNYNPGGLDGIWGGMTGGAISGFINDRELKIAAPTSFEMFGKTLPALRDELAKAEGEDPPYKRPIAIERAEATPAELAPKLPEVQKSITAERLGFWGSIAAAVTSAVTGVVKFMGDAVEMLNPLKEFVADLPWPVWVAGALAVSGALYYISRVSGQAKDAATQAYQEGARV